MLVGRAAAFVRDERRNAEWALRARGGRAGRASSAPPADAVPARAARRRARRRRSAWSPNLRWESRGIVRARGLGAVGPRRRRARRRRRSRRSTGRAPPASSPKAAAGPRTPPSWRARSASRRWSASPGATTAIPPGASVDLDGTTGECLINGDASNAGRLAPPHGGRAAGRALAASTAGPFAGPARTLDGIDIRLDANLERPDELADVARQRRRRTSGCSDPRACCAPDGRAPDEARAVRDLSAHPGGDAGRGHDPHLRPAEPRAGRPPSRPAHARRSIRRATTQFEEQIRALLASASAGAAAHPAAVRHRRRRSALRARRDRRAPPRRSVTPASRSRRCPSARWSKCRPRR